MDDRPCGCKGCRTCLICEKEFRIPKKDYYSEYKNFNSHVFCPHCNKIYPGWNTNEILLEHSTGHNNGTDGIEFPGVFIQLNFLTKLESDNLMKYLDNELEWQNSQSGRRKQNFGPKTNFKKRKLQYGNFNGFPIGTKFVQEKFNQIDLLQQFQTIEQCSLEYEPDKGSSIDPHIDDCWIWGERIVTVNCLGDSVLTLCLYDKSKNEKKYNLNLVENYRKHLICDLESDQNLKKYENLIIRIPMPNLSLIVLYGPPRYQFEHCVLREDVNERRVCLAYREFTPMYLKNGEEFEKGDYVTKKAGNFWKE